MLAISASVSSDQYYRFPENLPDACDGALADPSSDHQPGCVNIRAGTFPADNKLHCLHAGGQRLEYKFIQSTMDSERPVLVFLHEGLGSTALWKNFPEAVVEATGCSALVYSRYGYGKSELMTEARQVDYMHREALEVLAEVLAAQSIENPVLIGHSDGASIALIHAGAGRWPVRGLVLMAPHVFVEDITVASIAQAKVTFEATDLAVKLGRYHDDAVSTFWGWNNIWLHPDFRAWNIEEYLPRITAPVLLIQGEDDQYGTQAQIDAIARQVKGLVETVVLPRCGHSPHVDQKDATLQAIVAFVGALAAASSAGSDVMEDESKAADGGSLPPSGRRLG